MSSAAVERMRAVLLAAGVDVSGGVGELCRRYLALESVAEPVLLVLRGGGEEPELLRVLCLEPVGDVSLAERLGLLLRVGRSACLVYPGRRLAAEAGCEGV